MNMPIVNITGVGLQRVFRSDPVLALLYNGNYCVMVWDGEQWTVECRELSPWPMVQNVIIDDTEVLRWWMLSDILESKETRGARK